MGIQNHSLSYLKFLLTTKTRYRVHSPFLFNLITEVLRDRTIDADLSKVIKWRKTAQPSPPGKEGLRLLYKLAQYFQPEDALELGTVSGITTAALSFGSPGSKLITIESDPEACRRAGENLERLGANNVLVVWGEIGKILPGLLERNPPPGLVIFHSHLLDSATPGYFELCHEKAHEDALFIFRGMYRTKGTLQAWHQVCEHPATRVSVDLYHHGLVFFDPALSSQHYKLRY